MIGRNLVAWRETNGYSQLELSKALNVPISDIVKWETDNRAVMPVNIVWAIRALKPKDKTDS